MSAEERLEEAETELVEAHRLLDRAYRLVADVRTKLVAVLAKSGSIRVEGEASAVEALTVVEDAVEAALDELEPLDLDAMGAEAEKLWERGVR